MKTIYIGALPFKTNKEMLLKILLPFGPVEKLEIFADWENPRFEPYALAEVERAEEVVEKLDGYKIGEHHLRIHLKQNGGNKNG